MILRFSLLALSACFVWDSTAQTLDESLLDAPSSNERAEWTFPSGEAGVWTVWVEFDAGLIRQFEPNDRNNDIRRAATLGHPEWSSNTLTTVVNRMTNSGFDNAVYNADNYAPRGVRIGASRQVWKQVQAGIQVGQTWSPAYIEALRADGETVVASWHQIRYADLVDQYLYLDDLYNGDQWRYQNDSEFTDGLQGWTVELVAHQELAYGLGWTASHGRTLGLQGDLDAKAASLFGGQGLLPPDESAPTLTPQSVAAAPQTTSIGVTWRVGPVVTALSWARMSTSHKDKNTWVSAGADALPTLQQVRLRLGMTF